LYQAGNGLCFGNQCAEQTATDSLASKIIMNRHAIERCLVTLGQAPGCREPGGCDKSAAAERAGQEVPRVATGCNAPGVPVEPQGAGLGCGGGEGGGMGREHLDAEVAVDRLFAGAQLSYGKFRLSHRAPNTLDGPTI
jgi:hypothetical protein